MRTSNVGRFWGGKGKVVAFAVALLVLNSVGPASSVVAGRQATFGLHLDQTYASTGQQAVHDVAVTGIQASGASVLQGDTVDIDVAVQNLGPELETFDLILWDDTDSREINTISSTIGPNQTWTERFQWDTSTASVGLHTLSSTAVFASDQDTSNNSLILASPIDVKAPGIILGDGTGLDYPDASFGAPMQQVNIATRSAPATSIFIGEHDASLGGPLVRAAVSTQQSPHQGIFVANADATFQSSSALQNPFTTLQDPSGQGEVQGTVHLEGNISSLGGYIQVGPDIHFVESDGSFRISVPSGTLDILISAPGYIPVRVPNVQVNPGEVLTPPGQTLSFGDANGDGRIDILDLSIAASNFGETVLDVAAP
jgi:hypothetical protein